MEQQTTNPELNIEISPRENLRIKMKAIYGGLGRAIVGEEYQYKIFEDKMPTNEDLHGYLLAKADYLKDLYTKQPDFERKRQLELAEDRARLASETLAGGVSRPDLVVEEVVGLQLMCDKYETFPETKTGTDKLMEAESAYFQRVAEVVAGKLNTPLIDNVRGGTIDTDIYPVDFVGMLMPYTVAE